MIEANKSPGNMGSSIYPDELVKIVSDEIASNKGSMYTPHLRYIASPIREARCVQESLY